MFERPFPARVRNPFHLVFTGCGGGRLKGFDHDPNREDGDQDREDREEQTTEQELLLGGLVSKKLSHDQPDARQGHHQRDGQHVETDKGDERSDKSI